MSNYVDGFVVPVPKRNVDAYRELAAKAGALWIEHGALEYKECVADDVPGGQGDLVPAGRQGDRGRDRGLLLDQVRVARRPR